jgi:8-oxo-dGTP pyrophosphatase MutT (NUDIX family)
MKQEHYCLGFAFNEDRTKVVLIKKNKPDFLKGLLTGVGGYVEPNETPEEAMPREFEEETGVLITGWKLCGRFEYEGAMNHVYSVATDAIYMCRTVEPEEVYIVDTDFDVLLAPFVNVLIDMCKNDNLISNFYMRLK